MNRKAKLKQLYAANVLDNKLPKQIYRRFSKRLGMLNQLSPKENLALSIRLSIRFAIISIAYFIYAKAMIDALWYHNIFLVISTILFFLVIVESHFESIEKSIKENVPILLKKLLHYYIHYNRNIIVALEETEKRCPQNMKVYTIKIKEALMHKDYEEKINELQQQMPSAWLKMLCVLLMFAKRQGVPDSKESNEPQNEYDPISLSLRKMIKTINFINIEQKHNTAKLIGYQIFSFITPIITIPLVKLYYAKLNMMLNIGDPYADVIAQTLATIMLLSGNAVALYIHWLRKLQY